MITRIEIDGFKSFYNFSVDLMPFTVLIGGNGTGKSNLFDAIMLLSRLASGERISDALGKVRGGAYEAFSLGEDGTRYKKMKFAIEMLVNEQVTDGFGVTVPTDDVRLRYQFIIERRGPEDYPLSYQGFFINDETLQSISYSTDAWMKTVAPNTFNSWRANQSKTYLEPGTPWGWDSANKVFHYLRSKPLGAFLEPVLTQVNHNGQGATLLAARQEMRSWQIFFLQPDRLRAPSKLSESFGNITLAGDGSNLPNVLLRLSQQDGWIIRDIKTDMVDVLPGFLDLNVNTFDAYRENYLEFEMVDRQHFSAYNASDGTLRLLAFAVLRNDPLLHGVLCVEEPENGISPVQLSKMADLLRDTATNFGDKDDMHQMLRQVIVSTHSRDLMNLVDEDSLRLVYVSESSPRRTRMIPLSPELVDDEQIRIFAEVQSHKYLQKPRDRMYP